MKLLPLSLIILGLSVLSTYSAASMTIDELTVLRLSAHQHNQLTQYLKTTYCTCGCGMLLADCLRNDPTCPVSPELARAAIKMVANGPSNPVESYQSQQPAQERNNNRPTNNRPIINNSQNGSVLIGGECSYVSVPGGASMRVCD